MKYEKLLIPSGLNQHFCKEQLTFDSYIDQMKNIILEGRADLTLDNASEIILANSPFSWQPQCNSSEVENGVLLIHGLYDSPYYVQDLGQYFLTKGFQVNAILLPGHGTVPGDLLDIDYHEWLKAAQFGIAALAKRVKNIYLAGYSLGGTLALHSLLQNDENIKGLILIAPAIGVKTALRSYLAKYYPLYSWMGERVKWYKISESANYAKYACYPYNAAHQAYKLISWIGDDVKNLHTNVPIFIAMSQDDEVISTEAILSFFAGQNNPKNRLLIYSNEPMELTDPRITVRPSCYPDLKIINFSHSCLTISPKNPLFGIQSQYQDLTHYPNGQHLDGEKNIYSGATTKENLKKYLISRLSYNPDFTYMLQELDVFLD